MTRRVLEKLCTKKVCVDFLAPKDVGRLLLNLHWKEDAVSCCKLEVGYQIWTEFLGGGRFQGDLKHASTFM